MPSLKNYSKIYICFCLFGFSLSFTSRSFLCLFRCAWSMQVVVPWNETNKRKNYAKHELWLMIAQSHVKCFHSLYLLTISIFGTVQFICQKYIYTCLLAELCLQKIQWISQENRRRERGRAGDKKKSETRNQRKKWIREAIPYEKHFFHSITNRRAWSELSTNFGRPRSSD